MIRGEKPYDREKFASELAHTVSETLYFKSPAFAEEKEWRLIFAHLDDNVSASAEFCVGPLGVTPFVSANIGEGADSLIRHVQIGPCANPVEARLAVKMYLESSGITAGVSNSRVPIRG